MNSPKSSYLSVMLISSAHEKTFEPISAVVERIGLLTVLKIDQNLYSFDL